MFPSPYFPQESCQEYLQEDKLRGLVQRYSEFINFPILMLTTRTEEKEVRTTAACWQVNWKYSNSPSSR